MQSPGMLRLLQLNKCPRPFSGELLQVYSQTAVAVLMKPEPNAAKSLCIFWKSGSREQK